MYTSMCDVKQGQQCVIREYRCEPRFMSRLLSQGLTPGTKVSIKQSGRGTPMLIQAREATLAMNYEEAGDIKVEVL
ncbi:MAG: ferrous iron transport protein A [Deltaproteobacteria bacterium]|jgi:Fe2+ transport system protein FeoA|nr:ferrous iron transport protein A [Deltaproteobacteria bacterium]